MIPDWYLEYYPGVDLLIPFKDRNTNETITLQIYLIYCKYLVKDTRSRDRSINLHLVRSLPIGHRDVYPPSNLTPGARVSFYDL